MSRGTRSNIDMLVAHGKIVLSSNDKESMDEVKEFFEEEKQKKRVNYSIGICMQHSTWKSKNVFDDLHQYLGPKGKNLRWVGGNEKQDIEEEQVNNIPVENSVDISIVENVQLKKNMSREEFVAEFDSINHTLYSTNYERETGKLSIRFIHSCLNKYARRYLRVGKLKADKTYDVPLKVPKNGYWIFLQIVKKFEEKRMKNIREFKRELNEITRSKISNGDKKVEVSLEDDSWVIFDCYNGNNIFWNPICEAFHERQAIPYDPNDRNVRKIKVDFAVDTEKKLSQLESLKAGIEKYVDETGPIIKIIKSENERKGCVASECVDEFFTQEDIK